MECPRCGLHVNDDVPRCAGCGFTIADLDHVLGLPPPRAGALTDLAGLVDSGARATLDAHLTALSRTHGGELVVVTAPHTRPVTPRQYAFWLLNRWDVGGAKNEGLLVLIAKDERRVEVEVGYSWEPRVSDDEAGRILDDAVVPHLREGRFADAIRAGADALAAALTRQATASLDEGARP